MSTHLALSPIKEEDEQDIADELAVIPPADSILEPRKGVFEDEDEPELIWLKHTKHKNLFMAKAGLAMAINFAVWSLACLYIATNERGARQFYWQYKLYVSKWLYVLYAVSIRLLFAFGSAHIRSFSKALFALDLLIGFVAINGMYFYFALYLQTQYIYHGHYVMLLSFSLFASSIAFTLSCFAKDRRNVYNVFLGLGLMELATAATLYAASYYFKIPTLTKTKYKIVFAAISVINAYLAVNARFVLKYRGKKFYDFEYISCYFCMWSDWLYAFWRDATRGYRAQQAVLEEQMKAERREKKDAETVVGGEREAESVVMDEVRESRGNFAKGASMA